jgi:hypothetical protein
VQRDPDLLMRRLDELAREGGFILRERHRGDHNQQSTKQPDHGETSSTGNIGGGYVLLSGLCSVWLIALPWSP